MKLHLDPFDEAERLARQNGDWVVGALETHVFWPTRRQIIDYDDKRFLLLPREQLEGMPSPTMPAIALDAGAHRLNAEAARGEILRFASALCWQEGQKLEIVGWSGGNLPRPMGGGGGFNAVTEYLDPDYIPRTDNADARKALAFYREGVSLDNPFYSFLSFYKAFSVAVSNPMKRGTWITDWQHRIDERQARERLTAIEADGKQVGDYLYDHCRHAIAHADREPFVNPDSPADHFRVMLDRPLMRNYAELAIEDVFDVKRPSTLHRQHLYELDGFRALLPDELVANLKSGGVPDSAFDVDLPDRYILLARKRHETFILPEMHIKQAGCVEGGLLIDFQTESGESALRVILNYKDERLEFDPLQHIIAAQTRAGTEQIKEELELVRFIRCMLANGHQLF